MRQVIVRRNPLVVAPAAIALLALAGLLGQAPGAAAAPRLSNERILLRTSRGDLVIALYPEVAPRHTSQILKLVGMGVYDTTSFHRVQRGFLVQLTNAQNRQVPLRPEQRAAIQKIPAEFSNLVHQAGVVSMARDDHDPNSAETSFSILLGPAPHLDGKYTIVGELEWGMPLLNQLASEPVNERNTPLTPVVVTEALVKPADEIAQLRSAGLLQAVRLLPRAPDPPPGAARALAAPVTAGIVLMMACGLLGFLMAGRWKPQTVGAVSLLTVLTGGFLLFAELVPRAKSSAVVGVLVFLGMVSLFRLMNRFESAPPPRPTPPAEPPRP